MDLEKLQRAKCIEACINSSNKNIEHLKQLKTCDEIMIVANTSKARDVIKGIYYDRDKGNLPPTYYSGKDKDAIIDTILKKDIEFRDKHLKELDNL